MTEARTYKYKTNLARRMSAPGGRTVGEALRAAEGGLEMHREAAMRTLDANLTALEAACAARRPGTERQIYEQAAALLDMAGFFDTGPLHPVVFSLCEISDRMIENGQWDWPSVEVHVRALRLILMDDCRESENSRAILDGLAAVSRRSETRTGSS